MLLLALLATARADDTFWVGETLVHYGELVDRGAVKGRTGRLLVRGDASVVASQPGVRKVEPLRGGLLRVQVSGDDLAVARGLRGVPGIAHATPDLLLPLVPAALSRAMVEAVVAAGGTPIYSELPGVGHDSWTAAYRNPAVLDWLFAQRRR
jgi:hypothetical protein